MSKKLAKRARLHTKEVQDTEVYSDDGIKTYGEVSACSNVPKKMRSKRHTKKTRNCPKEVVDIYCSEKVKTCIESSESQSTCIASSGNQDSDNITIACFLRDKSKEMLSRFTKDLSQASFSSRSIDVSNKQVESQDPFDDQIGLSKSFDTVGTENLFVQQNVASDRRVGKPEDANTLTGGDHEEMTLACFLGNKSKKGSQAANGRGACSSTIIIPDDSGLSMSKHVEKETVLHGGVAEPMDIVVEEKDDELLTSLQNRPTRQRKRPSRFL